MADIKGTKSFTVRRFDPDLHQRLKILAARINMTQEELINIVMAEGLNVCEQKADAAVGRGIHK